MIYQSSLRLRIGEPLSFFYLARNTQPDENHSQNSQNYNQQIYN
jgi:hypothetical protein